MLMSASSLVSQDLPLKTMELPEDLEPDNPLWRFALAIWQHSAAQETCLALQGEGWSVTRILCAGWLALNGRAYTGIEEATVTEWRNRVTGSLRSIRRSVPKEQTAYFLLRTNLANLELEAERIELALVWRNSKAPNPEPSNMYASDELIQSNLTAAAPAAGTSPEAKQLLGILRDIISTLQPGGATPC